jgi:hypothetical protein
MVAHRAGALTVAVVAVAMLFAIGSWEVYQGAEALAQGPPTVEYKCYVLSQEPAIDVDVRLTPPAEQPQFPVEVVTVKDPVFFCVPVTKQIIGGATFTPPSNLPDLKCYNITPSGPPLNLPLTLRDQFSPPDEEVTVRTAQLLCTEVEKISPD